MMLSALEFLCVLNLKLRKKQGVRIVKGNLNWNDTGNEISYQISKENVYSIMYCVKEQVKGSKNRGIVLFH